MLDRFHRTCDWFLYQTLSIGFIVVDWWRNRRRRPSAADPTAGKRNG